MRDADATIERLLAGLRDAEPSAGMRRRLLEAIETHPAAASPSPWRRLTLPWLLRPAMALLLACVLAFTIKVHRHRDTPTYIRSHATAADAPHATAPEAVAQKAPARPHRKTSPVPLRPPQTGPESPVQEAQTASFPAPPLPLTDQEKLLLRLAHRNDPQDMTLLNRDAQAAQSAKATQQFQDFFAINPTEMRSESE
jgi:hypothetical protein